MIIEKKVISLYTVMIREYLNDSRRYLLEHKKFVNLAFIVWFCRFFYIVFFLAYNVNTLLTYKLEKWLSIFTIFQLFVDLVNENNLLRLVILVLILFAIWYALWYPIWISANIHFVDKDDDENMGTALSEGIKDFFSVFELNGLAFSFGAYMYFSTLFRLYILDVLGSGLAIWLTGVWWVCVFLVFFGNMLSIYWYWKRKIERMFEFQKLWKKVWIWLYQIFDLHLSDFWQKYGWQLYFILK